MEETEADLNSLDQDGWTMLMWAARQNHVEVMWLLVDAKVDVDVKDYGGDTALHHAVRTEHDDVVELLIDAQADLELRDEYGCTPLLDSVVRADSSIAALLLDAKADAWAADADGNTPMSYTLWSGIDLKDWSNRILQQSPNEHGVTALMLVASRGYANVIPRLLEMGEDPELEDKNGMTALMMAMMPREEEEDWRAGFKADIIIMLCGDRTNAELNEMRRVLYFPKEVPPLILPE